MRVWHAICFRENKMAEVSGHIQSRMSHLYLQWDCGFFRNVSISTTKMPMATKRGWLVTYHGGLLPTMSHDPLIKWFCEMTWWTKIIISTLPQCLWPANLIGWWAIKSNGSWVTWSCEIRWQIKNIIFLLP